ncbi:MAG TPA: GH116 family glycosyl hydrolase, partial [Vicinamibacteria bacterium]|nr:GH116 family glycosyl hydrolase [Vicinamibacteria bacterium]
MRSTSVLVVAAALGALAGAPARAEPVPRFEIAPSPLALTGDVRPRQYLGVIGPKAAWLGTETGEAELWVHPLKLANGFHLDFKVPEYDAPVRGADVARRVEVRPELTTIVYSHATFTVREHILAPLNEPGLLVLLEVETYRPLEVVVSFRSVFQEAWPGAFGGQYVFWDGDAKAFVLSESRRLQNAFIGSPWARTGTSHAAHALPEAPSQFVIEVDPGRASREFVPIAIAAAKASREEVAATYRSLIARARALYEERRAHAERLLGSTTSLTSPDPRLDLALEWAKVNLDEQTVCNPDLGCGLVAGFGPSGESLRPGFGWFFGGDAAINSFAMSLVGQRAAVAEGLRFLAKYQRADGKIPHEISQSAARIPWFTDFPYAYYHADTTPFWLVALWRHWRSTGDTAFVREMWPAVAKAWAFCLSTDTDGDGLMENTAAGLGAIEVGAIGEDIHEDVYLAAVGAKAAGAVAEMARAQGESALALQADAIGTKGERTLEERYWIEPAGHHAFGLLRSGRT